MRIRRFNKKYPKGFLFTDPEEFRKAEESGEWVDSYLKVNDDEAYKKPAPPVEPPKEETIVFVGEGQLAEKAKELGVTPEQKLCECGCGTPVSKRFAPGHYFRMTHKGKKHGNSKNGEPADQSGFK